jgi:AcrR family transcriptional regulator
MPKRDDKYMAAQRRTIASAALGTLLEKGLNDTSIRDICDRAGISMGALYVHFADKTDLVIAAFELSHENERYSGKVATWADYEAAMNVIKRDIANHRNLSRIRLSLQFAAEHIFDEENHPGLSEFLQKRAEYLRQALTHLKIKGEITLPLGLEATVETHTILLTGATYMAATDKDLDIDTVWARLLDALALTAGLKEKRAAIPRRAHSTKAAGARRPARSAAAKSAP